MSTIGNGDFLGFNLLGKEGSILYSSQIGWLCYYFVMARALRIQYPGAHYHVTCRGNEKRAVTATSPSLCAISISLTRLPLIEGMKETSTPDQTRIFFKELKCYNLSLLLSSKRNFLLLLITPILWFFFLDTQERLSLWWPHEKGMLITFFPWVLLLLMAAFRTPLER